MGMRLLVIRHAKAAAREEWHKDDHLRPLTKEGVSQAKLMFAEIKAWAEVEEIWTSPWTRARETASLASEKWKVPLREVDWLAGGAMSAQDRRWQLPRKRDLALVGHEPDLGELIGELCGGTTVTMRKCGAALLEGDPATGMELQFLLTPKLVAGLSGRDPDASMVGPKTPALPGVLRGSTALLLTIAAVVLWRFASFPVAAAGALVALLASWRMGEWLHGDRRWVAAFAAVPAAIAALLALSASGLWPQAWPCAIACQGGARYARIDGIPLPLIASVAWIGLLLAVGATRWAPPQIEHQRSAPTPRYLELLVWIAIGASLFFVWTAWRLRMPCSACGAYHTAALSVGGTLRAGRLRLGPRWLALAAGAAAPMLAFGWHLLRDLEPLPPMPAPHVESAWRASAASGLAWGDPSAPDLLEIGLDAQCEQCARDYQAFSDGMDRLLKDKSLRVRIRLITRASEAAGPAIDAWIYAAAAQGHARQALRALLGMREDVSVAEALRSPAAELIDLAALAADATAHQADADALRADDLARLRQLGYDGRTPFLVLIAADGSVIMRGSAGIDLDTIAGAIRLHAQGGPHE